MPEAIPTSAESISIAGFDPLLAEGLTGGEAKKRVYVILSAAPQAQWIFFFENCRKLPKHRPCPEAHIVGNYIAVDGDPLNPDEQHMRDLAEDVAAANAAFATFMARSLPVASTQTTA